MNVPTGIINILMQFKTAAVAMKSLTIPSVSFTTSGKDYVLATMPVPVGGGGVALPLGALLTSPATPLGQVLIKNNGAATDVIELLSAVGGTVLARASSGRGIAIELPSGVTMPAVVAVSSASPPSTTVDIEYFILPI